MQIMHIQTKPLLSLQKKPDKGQSSESGKEKTMQHYKEGLDKLERDDDAKTGSDSCVIASWSRDFNLFPNITSVDIISYLVFRFSPYIKEELRCYTDLDTYNQFVNGSEIQAAVLINDKCIVTPRISA